MTELELLQRRCEFTWWLMLILFFACCFWVDHARRLQKELAELRKLSASKEAPKKEEG